jgi:hypothetical protein
MHGDRAMKDRVRALDAFRDREVRVLVATDVAQRGLDVEGISHVVNYDVPQDPDSYVHRVGRTARAGQKGEAITFMSPRRDRRAAGDRAPHRPRAAEDRAEGYGFGLATPTAVRPPARREGRCAGVGARWAPDPEGADAGGAGGAAAGGLSVPRGRRTTRVSRARIRR